MNIAKAIGIIAVVLGHSAVPGTSIITLFHMQLFFFILGYFFKDSYISNPLSFIIKNKDLIYTLCIIWIDFCGFA